MAFTKKVVQTSKYGVDFEDSATGEQRRVVSLSPIHYDKNGSLLPVDFTPRRINPGEWAKYPSFNGWLVDANEWWFALSTNGWVYYGSRGGDKWFRSRIKHLGYLSDPVGNPNLAQNWVNISDAKPTATWSVPNLSTRAITTTIGGTVYTTGLVVTWSKLWTTPGGGDVSLRLVMKGNRMKSEYVINEVARNWISANATPAQKGIPLSTAYFALALEADWSDTAGKYINGVLQGNDFTDANGGVEMRDALGELIGFLPIGEIYINEPQYLEPKIKLRKRFWHDADGTDYIVAGAKVTDIVTLPAGDLVLDPTVTPSIAASGDDGIWVTGLGLSTADAGVTLGRYVGTYSTNTFWRFATVNVPNAATINNAYITFIASSTDASAFPTLTIYGVDADNQAAPASEAAAAAMVEATATVAWTSGTSWTAGNSYNTPDISTIVKEIVDRAGWASGNAMVIEIFETSGTGSNRRAAATYDHATYAEPVLTIDYTSGGVSAVVQDIIDMGVIPYAR